MFPELPPFEADEQFLNALGRGGGPCDCGDIDDYRDSLGDSRGLTNLRPICGSADSRLQVQALADPQDATAARQAYHQGSFFHCGSPKTRFPPVRSLPQSDAHVPHDWESHFQ